MSRMSLAFYFQGFLRSLKECALLASCRRRSAPTAVPPAAATAAPTVTQAKGKLSLLHPAPLLMKVELKAALLFTVD